jgi:hypothetical protein
MRCEQYAVVIYQDEAGLLHGFCARHLAAGINAAARHGWTIRVES